MKHVISMTQDSSELLHKRFTAVTRHQQLAADISGAVISPELQIAAQ